jgi:hypothetical protein
MRRNGDRGLVGGDREILDRGLGFHRTGDRWLPDRWLGMPSQGPVTPPVTPFDPTKIAGLQGWWDSQKITGLNNGDLISSWPDSSGNNNHALGTAGSKPTYFTNALTRDIRLRLLIPLLLSTGAIEDEERAGEIADAMTLGKPVVYFQGGAWMTLTTPIPATAPWTTIAVMGANTYYQICALSNNGSFTGWDNVLNAGPGDGTAYIEFNDGFTTYTSPGVLNGGFKFYVITVVNAGSTRNIYVNGVDQLPLSGSAYSNGANPFHRIGVKDGLEVNSIGFMAEVVHYNSALSKTDRSNVEKYLGDKYGLNVAPGGVAGLKAWWKADALTLSDGASVMAWPDSTGKGLILTPNDQPRAPIYHATAGPNGKPVVSFNGVDQTIMLNPLPTAIAQPMTVLAVFDYLGLTNPYVNGFDLGSLYTASCELFAGAFGFSGGTPVALTVGTYQLITGVFNGAASQLYSKGVLQFQADAGAGPLPAIGLGMHAFGTLLKTNICEILVYSGILSAGDRAAVNNYLADKYGFPRLPWSPDQITGLKGWWKADAIITSGLLKGVKEVLDNRGKPAPESTEDQT